MRIVLAIDSFKGCLTSAEAEEAMAAVWRKAGHEVVCVPVSDGGEGLLQALVPSLGGRLVTVGVHDPLMRPVQASYAVCPGGLAVVEVAQACGLTLLAPAERDIMCATSYGVGELVADAFRRGCRQMVVGLGGTAVSDAGRGMARALTDLLGPSALAGGQGGVLGETRFLLATDVDNPLCGPEGAAQVFAPQKGALPAQVARLDRQARQWAALQARRLGYDRSAEPGAGAAGGLGYAFMQLLGAEVRPGAEVLLDTVGFDRLLEGVSLVVTGEGRADGQTLRGKLPLRVLQRARRRQVPVWLVAGQVDAREQLLAAGFQRVEASTPAGMPLAEALRRDTAQECLRRLSAAWLPAFGWGPAR